MRNFWTILLFAVLFLTGTDTSATTVIAIKTTSELVSRSEHILQGETVVVQGFRNEKGRIFTRVIVAVDEYMKHENPQGISYYEFLMPGGAAPDGMVRYASGFPKFKVGREAILFMGKANQDGVRVPVGLGQGRFFVERNKDGDPITVKQDSSQELTYLSPKTGKSVKVVGLRVDYYDFLEAVRAEVKKQALVKKGGK